MAPKLNVTLIQCFVAEHREVFDELVSSVRWDERLRARKTASFGVSYNYSGMTYPQINMPENLTQISQRVFKDLGFTPNNCLLNYYLDGEPRKGLEPSRVAPLVPETRRARGTRALSLSGAARQWLYAQVNLAELAGAACE